MKWMGIHWLLKPGPDSLKDLVQKVGVRIKLYKAIQALYSEETVSILMSLIHYSKAPLSLFNFLYTLDSLLQYLPFANGAGGVGIF